MKGDEGRRAMKEEGGKKPEVLKSWKCFTLFFLFLLKRDCSLNDK